MIHLTKLTIHRLFVYGLDTSSPFGVMAAELGILLCLWVGFV